MNPNIAGQAYILRGVALQVAKETYKDFLSTLEAEALKGNFQLVVPKSLIKDDSLLNVLIHLGYDVESHTSETVAIRW